MAHSIDRGCVQTGCSAGNWEDAIRVASEPLVEEGRIRKGYVDAMVQSVHDLGPYIVITPGLALAHAAPSEDVLETCLSVATFDDDITFGSENDPVRVVMCLASTDREAHIARLQAVAEKLLEDTGFVRAMAACEEPDSLYELINS